MWNFLRRVLNLGALHGLEDIQTVGHAFNIAPTNWSDYGYKWNMNNLFWVIYLCGIAPASGLTEHE